MDSQAILSEIPRLRRYARALLGERAAADDLVQDTLERAWTRSAQWREGSDLRAWLFGIMHNLRIDQLRRALPNTRPVEDGDFEQPTRATQSDGLEVNDLAVALGKRPLTFHAHTAYADGPSRRSMRWALRRSSP